MKRAATPLALPVAQAQYDVVSELSDAVAAFARTGRPANPDDVLRLQTFLVLIARDASTAAAQLATTYRLSVSAAELAKLEGKVTP